MAQIDSAPVNYQSNVIGGGKKFIRSWLRD